MPVLLPVELLEQIFKDAVAFPDVASTSISSPRYPLYYDLLPSYEIKLSTSRINALALVCRQWNAICTPRLYQCLAILDTTPTDALIRTLDHSQTTDSGSLPPLGSFTRHLIIALSDDSADKNEPECYDSYETIMEQRFGSLDRLARYLPHLQTLSIAIGRGDNGALRRYLDQRRWRSFADVITQTCAQSLRNLHLHSYPRVLFDDEDLRKLFESAPNLVTITNAAGGDQYGCPASLPYLPKLKYLALNSKIGTCDGTDHKDNQTPSLDHVHIRPSQFSNYWEHLLSAQGARLRFVFLDLRPFWAGFRRPEYLTTLTAHCPNLSYLGICASNWDLCPRLDPLPPVEHLNICIQSPYAPVARICARLATIQSPSIKVVCLMNKDMFEWFGSRKETDWSLLAAHKFRVVDRQGRELGPPGHSS